MRVGDSCSKTTSGESGTTSCIAFASPPAQLSDTTRKVFAAGFAGIGAVVSERNASRGSSEKRSAKRIHRKIGAAVKTRCASTRSESFVRSLLSCFFLCEEFGFVRCKIKRTKLAITRGAQCKVSAPSGHSHAGKIVIEAQPSGRYEYTKNSASHAASERNDKHEIGSEYSLPISCLSFLSRFSS
jgi:hypothetical protein